MGNAVGNFMKGWLNTTYQYLKESGGGPTYPAPTIGPNVPPSGEYSLKEDYPLTEFPITQYKNTEPISFNPYNMGLPAITPNQNESAEEISKQIGEPHGFSDVFYSMFGASMQNCLTDQTQRAQNPNAEQACRDCADTGDISKIILRWVPSGSIGPKTTEIAKSDVVQIKEQKMEFTDKIAEGTSKIWTSFTNIGDFMRKAPGFPAPSPTPTPTPSPTPSGDPNDPEGSNFQAIGNSVKSFIDPFIPKAPSVPGLNSGTVIMVGGGIILLVLVIAVIK